MKSQAIVTLADSNYFDLLLELISSIKQFEQSKNIDFSFIGKKMKSKMSGGNNPPFAYTYNKIRHQFKNSECGIYSINFLDESLRKQPRRTTSLSDDQVHRLREYFYHPVEMKNGKLQSGGNRKTTKKNKKNKDKKQK